MNDSCFSRLKGDELVPRAMRNRYAKGGPHGKGRWLFVDGSSYEGEAYNGRISGRGKYTRSDRYVLQGRFKEGVLHGADCTMSQRVAVGEPLNGYVYEDCVFVRRCFDLFSIGQFR